MMRKPLLIIAVCFFHLASAQTFSAAVDKQKILIGEQFHLELLAGFDKGKEAWVKMDSLPHFEIMESSKIDTQEKEGRIVFSQIFLLTSWDSGQWTIPPILLGKMHSKPIRMDVAFSPSPFDVNQPYHDIKDIIPVKRPIESKWYWYLLFAAVLLLLFLLFFPKGKKRPKPAFVPDEGAYRSALKKLEQLRKKEVATDKLFYTELVNIFREYLHRRKNIQSFSKTTDDLAVQVKKLDMPVQEYNSLLQTLRLSDLVKFARFEPSASDKDKSIDTIKESIANIEQLQNVV